MKSKKKVKDDAKDKYWFGLKPPKGVELSWGARAVLMHYDDETKPSLHWLEFYPNRQQMSDYQHPRKKEFMDWINSLGLSDRSTRQFDDTLDFCTTDGKHLKGEARGGYYYFVAWIDKEIKIKCPNSKSKSAGATSSLTRRS